MTLAACRTFFWFCCCLEIKLHLSKAWELLRYDTGRVSESFVLFLLGNENCAKLGVAKALACRTFFFASLGDETEPVQGVFRMWRRREQALECELTLLLVVCAPSIYSEKHRILHRWSMKYECYLL